MMDKNHHHFGIYALIINDEKILLVKKIRGAYEGLYDLPGGTPEPSETLQETLHREVWEETGAEVISEKEYKKFNIDYNYIDNSVNKTLNHTGHIFLTKVNMISSTIKSADTSGCLWLPINNLNNITPLVSVALENYNIPKDKD